MTVAWIAALRLLNQQIESSKFRSAIDLVRHMGAMQAQDYSMAKWAVGLRLPNSSNNKIEEAVNNGEIIRTHLLRPTWHFVSAEDIHWMLELTAPQLRKATMPRHKHLGLTEKILSKSNHLIEKTLRDENHLTREELMEIIAKAKIPTGPEMSIHLMFRAEIDRIVCSGKMKNNKQTYALLAERAPIKKYITKEEALALLAKKYFNSRAPATLKDFIWWSGLLAKDAAYALDMIKNNFISEKMGDETYWITNSFDENIIKKSSVQLLPAFDEFLISYKDRTASLHTDHYKKSISNNGIFWPAIVINGQITGSWKRSIKKEKIIIEPTFFKPHNKKTIAEMGKTAERFGQFLEKEIVIDFK